MKRNIISRRPAESGTLVAGAIAFLVGSLVGLDGPQQGALTIIVAAVPGAITWVVELRRRRAR